MIKSYKTKPCKGCGGPVRTSLKKPYCSHECRISTKPKAFEMQTRGCVSCGKEVTRKVYFRDPQRVLVCSLECQNQWALIANRGTGCGSPDWVARSRKAKKRYKNEHRAMRLNNEKNWVIKMCIAATDEKKETNPFWVERKCESASRMLNAMLFKRQSVYTRKQAKQYSWGRFCKIQLNRCYSKWMREDATWIRMKCQSTSGNWSRKQRF